MLIFEKRKVEDKMNYKLVGLTSARQDHGANSPAHHAKAYGKQRSNWKQTT